MTFLSPILFWLGAAAALGPIIIHLLNRRRYRVIDWAAGEFLLESFKKTKRRIRLEQLLLLALRVAGICLMGLALARPFVPEDNPVALFGARARTDHIVILDDSYSMAQTLGSSTIFAKAREALLQISDRVQPEDTFAVLLTSRKEKPLFAPGRLTDRVAFKRDAVALTPSDFSTDLPPVIEAALDAFANSSNPEKHLYILTDCRRRDWSGESSRRIRAQLEKLDKRVARGFLLDFGVADAPNLSITEFSASDKEVVRDLRTRFRVTVANRGTQAALDVPVTFRTPDAALPPRTIDRIAPGASATLDFSYVFRKPGPTSVSVSLPADALAPDNTAYQAFEVRDGVPALIVNGAPDPEPYLNETDYLVAALDPGAKGIGGWRPVVVLERELPAVTFDKYDLVMLANVTALPAAKVAELEAYVRNGGGLCISLGDRLDRAFYNSVLFKEGAGLLPAKLGVMEGDPNNAAKFYRLKLETGAHPIQSALGGELSPLLSRVHIRAFVPMEISKPNAESGRSVSVLASFDDRANTPALVERRFGNGRVILFGSTVSARWHDWPGNPSYLVFVQELFSYLARTPLQDRTTRVGAPIERVVEPQFIDGSVTLKTPLYPEQSAIRLTPRPVADQMRVGYTEANRAGIYELALEGRGTQRIDRYARNIDPDEGDLAKAVPAELVTAIGEAPVRVLPNLATAELNLSEQRRGTEFWKYVLIILLAVLAVEQTLARRFTHYA